MENGKKQVAEACFDLLFAAMIDTLREGGSSSNGNGSGSSSSEPRSEELLAETVRAIGFDVGYRCVGVGACALILNPPLGWPRIPPDTPLTHAPAQPQISGSPSRQRRRACWRAPLRGSGATGCWR